MSSKKGKLNPPSNLEKAALLSGNGSWFTYGIDRLGVKSVEMHDGPLGVRKVGNDPDFNLKTSEAAVCFPAPCLTACSFDRELMKELGETLGKEARLKKTQVLLAPGANIKRNPLCGRNFEYLSEDPVLSGKMASSYIVGLQEMNVGACLKHFACNSQEYFRMVNNSIVDERALRELYLRPFEIAVKESSPWMVMASYNKINGVFACENSFLLRDVLKKEWGYEGVVVSDWGALNDPIASHENGLDLEMPSLLPKRGKQLAKAVKKGKLSQKALDDSYARLASLSSKANAPCASEGGYTMEEGHKVAVKVAEQSAVLLKNDGVLPLKNYRDCAIIGEFAKTPRYQGAGSSHVVPHRLVSFLDALKEDGVDAPYLSGYDLDSVWTDGDVEAFVAAIDLASKSKNVVFFMGLPDSFESEGLDRKNMHLPEEQLRLFDEIYEVNQNIIVVLCCGAPVELPFKDKAKAILLMYLPGEGGGEAINNLLLGRSCPSGKLAESWPKHISDVPSFGFYPGEERASLYRESIYVGYRYYATVGLPVNFPFGYGLSYAKSSIKKLILSKESISKGETVKAEVSVNNASSFPIKKVVEIYGEYQNAGNAFRPKRVLLDFAKVDIPAKSTKTVQFSINFSDFQVFDISSSSWKVEPGIVLIEAAESSEDIVCSASLALDSNDVIESLRLKMPTYYSPTKEGFLQFDNDFEALYGRHISMERDPKSRPYNLNSTFFDISSTWLGKKIYYFADKKASINKPGHESEKAFFEQTPLRNVIMAGLSEKYAYALRDCANGHYISALIDIVFNRKKGD